MQKLRKEIRLMATTENLKPPTSTSEARKRGKKGGIKSGKVRKEKKAMKETAEMILGLTLKDGTVHKLSKNINTTLTADTRLTLNIVIGDIFIGGESGDFTIESWKEASETIEFPIVY